MGESVRGCHHCIGTGVTVANLVFNFVEGQARTGEALSEAAVGELRRRFITGLTSGYDFFETIHRQCMEASLAPERGQFARERVLASVLRLCGLHAAQQAFKNQIACSDLRWLDEFFCAFARFVGEHIWADVDNVMIDAYVSSAAIHKARLTVPKLLLEPKTHEVVNRCIGIFTNNKECEDKAEALTNSVNNHLAGKWCISGAHPAKTTPGQVRQFLTLLPKETHAVMAAVHR